jgi:hypothetical protein
VGAVGARSLGAGSSLEGRGRLKHAGSISLRPASNKRPVAPPIISESLKNHRDILSKHLGCLS